jgi:pyruvate dehydrogenase E1 component alpha subunit
MDELTTAPDDGLGPLADPEAFHGPIDVTGADPAELRAALERMLLIRRVEEVIADGVRSGEIRCPCHLAIGQEGCAVGVSAALRPGDRSFGAHRSHGHYLALGGDVEGLFAEVLGRDTGVSRGMGGSMHLQDRARGLYGTVPIVGATIPIAVGAALAARLAGGQDIAVSYFGDGATEEGGFHESMNLAVTLPAPVLFVCENNLFSSHLHISLRQPHLSTRRYAVAHRVPSRLVDGNDVVAVARAARELVAAMRTTGGPGFLELVTYRWRGHVGWRDDEDVGVARKADLPQWKSRDPVRRLKDGLVAAGAYTEAEFTAAIAHTDAFVAAAWARAKQAPFPPPEALLDRVYGRRPALEARA